MKNIYFLLLAHFAFFCSAQVGINTNLPQGKFHVDAAKNNTTELTDLQKNDDFVVKSDGKIGLGNTNPAVRLDARSANDSNSAIAIGYTDATASSAGAGVIRYNNTSGGLLQISDGSKWGTLLSTPTKSFVAAHIVAENASKKINSTAKAITGWTTVKDTNSDFNASTGVFTARRDGVYNINFTYDFVQGSVIAASNVEAQIVKGGNAILVKCLKTFGKSNREAQAGGICNSSVALNKDETIEIRLLQNIDTVSRGLRSTTDVSNGFFGFNNISIVEL